MPILCGVLCKILEARMKDQIKILAIETSCDETAAAVVQDGREVLSNVIFSQIDIHQKFGGVVPEVASRKHIEYIAHIVEEALIEAECSKEDIDAIAVTYGPGLVGALLVGVAYAKALSFAWDKPLIAVNHLHGHISGNFISHKELEPPFLCLVVSGGHTHILGIKDMYNIELMGGTRDDAAGEAFDKIARSLKLPYPGGPQIDRLSKLGNKEGVKLPTVKLKDGGYDFSFSGLKSSVLNYLNQMKLKNNEINDADVAASFQEKVVEQLLEVTIRCAKENKYNKIVLAGGVSANTRVREVFKEKCQKEKYDLYFPELKYCTDNAAMIGAAAYYSFKKSIFADMKLNACPQIGHLMIKPIK